MKYPFYIRMTILLCVGGFVPIMIHHIIMKLWDVSILRAAEKINEIETFIVCIPFDCFLDGCKNKRTMA